jgi:uncharacterized membrane protein YccF (DUF307 family)
MFRLVLALIMIFSGGMAIGRLSVYFAIICTICIATFAIIEAIEKK